MSSRSEHVSSWYKPASPEEKKEALNNLSKENFKGQSTSPDWPIDYVRSLRESGHLSEEEAFFYRNKIKKLAKRK